MLKLFIAPSRTGGCFPRLKAPTQIGWLDNGHPMFKTFSAKTRKEVIEKKKKYDENKETLTEKVSGRLKEELMHWLYTKKKIALKPSSFDRLKMTIESNILPRIGQYQVSQITSDIIQDRIINEMMNCGLSRSTIKKSYDALNSFYKQCIIDRKIVYNPVAGVVMPAVHKFDTKTTRALTAEEISRFEATATKVFSNGKPIYRHGYGYIFILYTGIRSGEALALQYKHIDLKNRTLKIEQSFVDVRDDTVPSNNSHYISILQSNTKSASGCRTIHLCDKALTAIKDHIRINYNGNDEDFVFSSISGDSLMYRNFRKSINAVYKAANIEASGFHILRHTMASLMFAQQIDIKYISAFLGHSGVQITYDTYVHIIKELEDKSIKELNNI